MRSVSDSCVEASYGVQANKEELAEKEEEEVVVAFTCLAGDDLFIE